LLQGAHGFAHGFSHAFGHERSGIHQLLTQSAADWNTLLGHAGHVTHGVGHGFAQGAGLAHGAHGADSAANAGMANATANTATNANTAIFFIVIPPFWL